MESRSEKRKGQKILVNVVEAEIVRTNITLAESGSASKQDEVVYCLWITVDPFTSTIISLIHALF